MRVFPNPALGESTISGQAQGGTPAVAVRVTDLLGHAARPLLDARQSAGSRELG